MDVYKLMGFCIDSVDCTFYVFKDNKSLNLKA